MPGLDSGDAQANREWRTTLKRLAPGAYNVHVQTTPREATASGRATCRLAPASIATCASSTSSRASTLPSRSTRRRSTPMPGAASSSATVVDQPRRRSTARRRGIPGVVHASELRPPARRQGKARRRRHDRAREHRAQRHETVRRSIQGRGRGRVPGRVQRQGPAGATGVPVPHAPARRGPGGRRRGPGPRDRPAGPDRRLPRPDRVPRILGDLVRALPRADGSAWPRSASAAARSWRNDVALVAVGIDNDREQLRRYVQQNGLATVQHLWSPQDKSEKAGDTPTRPTRSPACRPPS